MKTSELIGADLDRAVAKAERLRVWTGDFYAAQTSDCPLQVEIWPTGLKTLEWVAGGPYSPSTDWSQGGPIIEREGIALRQMRDGMWIASTRDVFGWDGPAAPTPLIAAMRCYVASKMGDEIEILKELV